MATIYELKEAYQQLLELAEDQYTDQTVLADTMEALEGEIEAKADGYAKVISELRAKAKAIKQEEDRLADRIDNVNEIPEEFLIPQPAKLDNEAVKRVLKNGENLNWCHLTQTESLRIR